MNLVVDLSYTAYHGHMDVQGQHICGFYTQYTSNKNGKVVVVVNGYTGSPTAKDSTYLRWISGCLGSVAHFTENMTLQSKKKFLSNKKKH